MLLSHQISRQQAMLGTSRPVTRCSSSGISSGIRVSRSSGSSGRRGARQLLVRNGEVGEVSFVTVEGQLTAVDAATQTNGKPGESQDVEDLAWKKAQTKVTIFSSQQYVESYLDQPFRDAGFANLNFVEARLERSTAELAEESPIICLFVNDNCDAKVVKKIAAEGVKLIVLRCAGFDRVDLKACAEAGIKVARVPTYSPTSVAEHAVALLFTLNRKIALAYARVRAGNYSLGPLVGMELNKKKVGVLGTGAIGAEAVRIFKGMGMEVLAYDIAKNPKVVDMGVPYMSVEEILPQADVVSLHLPLLPSTYEFINKPRIRMMKPGCILLNVSRGGLIDTDEIMKGLENGQIGGLGLDVWENEQDLFFTDWSELDVQTRMAAWDRKFKTITSYPQVVITPHSAFLTYEALGNIAATTVQNMEEFLAGHPLTNEIKARI